jgi:hypothetical protein
MLADAKRKGLRCKPCLREPVAARIDAILRHTPQLSSRVFKNRLAIMRGDFRSRLAGNAQAGPWDRIQALSRNWLLAHTHTTRSTRLVHRTIPGTRVISRMVPGNKRGLQRPLSEDALELEVDVP